MQPDFEEKQYEAAANGELRQNNPHLYVPGQVAERILGFDAAALQLPGNPIWALLQNGAPPGIHLIPNLWPAGAQPGPDLRLPSYVVSLILQYKRADYLTRVNASQYDHWGMNYFRFELLPHQHVQLLGLEANVGTNAVVRYSAPVFFEYSELETSQLQGVVLARSNFVSPVNLGANHRVWTYTQPGTSGWANPEAEKVPAQSWDEVASQLQSETRPTTVLRHLRAMAAELARVGLVPDLAQSEDGLMPTQRFAQLKQGTFPVRLTTELDLLQGFIDLICIGSILGRCSSSWWLHVRPV
jgi:hypothetical protein